MHRAVPVRSATAFAATAPARASIAALLALSFVTARDAVPWRVAACASIAGRHVDRNLRRRHQNDRDPRQEDAATPTAEFHHDRLARPLPRYAAA